MTKPALGLVFLDSSGEVMLKCVEKSSDAAKHEQDQATLFEKLRSGHFGVE